MEVILIRHGEPLTVETDGEPADPELSERGRWQAERVSHWLACEPIDCIVTSSKTRAKQTVAPLVEALDLSPLEIRDFDEIDRRATVYAPFQVMPQHFPDYWRAIQEQRWADIGWDSFEYFQQRVVTAWQELVASRPGERVAIGCHGGVIGVIAAHVTGVAQQWAFSNAPFASISRVVIGAAGHAQVHSLNEVGHFDATRRRVVGPEGEGFEEDFMQALAESRT